MKFYWLNTALHAFSVFLVGMVFGVVAKTALGDPGWPAIAALIGTAAVLATLLTVEVALIPLRRDERLRRARISATSIILIDQLDRDRADLLAYSIGATHERTLAMEPGSFEVLLSEVWEDVVFLNTAAIKTLPVARSFLVSARKNHTIAHVAAEYLLLARRAVSGDLGEDIETVGHAILEQRSRQAELELEWIRDSKARETAEAGISSKGEPQ